MRVLKYLPNDWNFYDLWVENVAFAKGMIQRAQCCFDTDWCETRLSENEMDSCRNYFEWYDGRHYFIRGAELYVMICLLINVFKFVYLGAMDFFLHGKFPLQDEFEDISKVDWLME